MTRGRRHAGGTVATARGVGLSLVEVLVALTIMATVAAALFALQAGGLRAARTAALTRQLAAELRLEATLARVLVDPATGCRGTNLVGACDASTTCLDEVVPAAGCDLVRTTIEVTDPGGRVVTLVTVAYAPLEAAPVGVAAEVQAASSANAVGAGSAAGALLREDGRP